MTDWQRIHKMLLKESEPIFLALFAAEKAKGDTVAAIGYTYEFGRKQLCFEICANTLSNAKKTLGANRAKWPQDARWNSGDYDFPGGVQDHFGRLSDEWWKEMAQLDRLAEDDRSLAEMIHQQVAEICCEVLTELARRGVLGDWSAIDFNVAALLDDVRLVEIRDQQIRKRISSKS